MCVPYEHNNARGPVRPGIQASQALPESYFEAILYKPGKTQTNKNIVDLKL